MCKSDADCSRGQTCTSGTCTATALGLSLPARAILLAAILGLCSCGVSLADIGKLGLVVTARATQCQAERAAAGAPQGPALPRGPKCAAAERCAGAAEVVIMGEAPTAAQFAAATTICAGGQ